MTARRSPNERLAVLEQQVSHMEAELARMSGKVELAGYPNWEIVIAVSNSEKAWPPMGLVIRDDEIIDGLQRRYFPAGVSDHRYEGSRPQGSQFGDVMYSRPWRF